MKTRGKKAFTLIEVLVASLVVTVGILGYFSLFARSSALVSTIRENLTASYVLQEQMELMRRTSFTDILSTYSAPTNFNVAGVLLGSPTGTVTVDYPFGTSSPNDKIIRITARLSWVTSGGQVKNKSVATYVTEGGMGD